MNLLKCTTLFVLIALCLQYTLCLPVQFEDSQIDSSNIDALYRHRRAPEDAETPVDQTPGQLTQQEPPVEAQTPAEQNTQQAQNPQEPILGQPKQEDVPIKQRPEEIPVNPPSSSSGSDSSNEQNSNEADRNQVTTTCSTCVLSKAKPDFSKAIAIAVKGNAIAAGATAVFAAPAVLKSAKIAALAALIPIKLAAKGAIIGTLIAKPIIIKSAIVGAVATKLSHLIVGKPIAIGANLWAGIEALKAKARAKSQKCVSATCNSISGGSSSTSSENSSSTSSENSSSSGVSQPSAEVSSNVSSSNRVTA